VLAEDETDVLLFPPLRAAWARRGQATPVGLTGWNARRVVFGALNVRTGARVFLARERQRSVDYQVFLRQLRRQYPGRRIVLLADEDPSHTARASQSCAAQAGIEVLWLPKRSPHLNPMDHLWRPAKQQVCANRQYPGIDVAARRLIAYLAQLTPHEARRKAGLLAPHGWLQPVLSKHFCGPT
jgi:DDE superfamily endonuclease